MGHPPDHPAPAVARWLGAHDPAPADTPDRRPPWDILVAAFLALVVVIALVVLLRDDRSGALDQPSTPGITRSGLERDRSR